MTITNQKELLTFSNDFRNTNYARNTYFPASAYNVIHPNALATGDEKGKGEMNGMIGGKTDIITRNTNQARNFYNKDKIYGII